jgi:hypothetical protein
MPSSRNRPCSPLRVVAHGFLPRLFLGYSHLSLVLLSILTALARIESISTSILSGKLVVNHSGNIS